MQRFLFRVLLFPLALFFVFEGWLWETLAPLVAWIVATIPFHRLKAAIAAWVLKLPPGPTLLVFLLPALVLFPFKLLGLHLLAHGRYFAAALVIAGAKVAGMGVTAFLFNLTRPKLLELPWFRKLYGFVNRWLTAAHVLVDPIRKDIERTIRLLRPKKSARAWRLIRRLRNRMHQENQR